jgi:hypothetical protein
MCLCDLIVTSMQKILRNRNVTRNLTGKVGLIVTYPTTESDALVDIVHVGIVVPLDAV